MLGKTFHRNLDKEIYVNSSNKPADVAEAFASHFSSVYTNSDDAKSEFDDICRGSSSHELSCDDVFRIVNVELIDKCIRKLKLGKASGPDELSAEHLVHVHSSLVVHLCLLFRSIILHAFVSNNFDLGLVIPLIKDKTGNPNCLSNYRGITLIAVISKLFKGVLLDVCDSYLTAVRRSKVRIEEGPWGCTNAIFSLQ